MACHCCENLEKVIDCVVVDVRFHEKVRLFMRTAAINNGKGRGRRCGEFAPSLGHKKWPLRIS